MQWKCWRDKKNYFGCQKLFFIFFFVTPNHIFLAFFLFGYSVDGLPWGEERREYG
jgi:hypothetical protein